MTAIPPPTWDALMRRYFGEIERNLDAAELLCRKGYPKKCPACAFRNLNRTGDCCLSDIRSGKGERIPPGEPVQEIGQCIPAPKTFDLERGLACWGYYSHDRITNESCGVPCEFWESCQNVEKIRIRAKENERKAGQHQYVERIDKCRERVEKGGKNRQFL